MAMVDTVGICDFAQTGFGAENGLDNVCKMVSAKSGKPFSAQDWNFIGKTIIKTERGFNQRAGFTKEQDRLPKMFYQEPLPPHNKVVVISDQEMDTTFNF
jgi:aldehyde:ferredoxin oxidoreductase